MPNFLTFITGTAHAKANDHASRRSRVMRMLGHCWVGFSQQNPLPHPVCSFTISSDCCTGTISGSAFWSSTSRKVPLNVFFFASFAEPSRAHIMHLKSRLVCIHNKCYAQDICCHLYTYSNTCIDIFIQVYGRLCVHMLCMYIYIYIYPLVI